MNLFEAYQTVVAIREVLIRYHTFPPRQLVKSHQLQAAMQIVFLATEFGPLPFVANKHHFSSWTVHLCHLSSPFTLSSTLTTKSKVFCQEQEENDNPIFLFFFCYERASANTRANL